MKETERVRGGDVVDGRLSNMTSVYVFSPGRGVEVYHKGAVDKLTII